MHAPLMTHRPVSPLSRDVLERFDRPGPRYTSYPTADRFTDAVDHRSASDAWRTRRTPGRPVSIYVHIPFCESICYYCACNKSVTRDRSRAQTYLVDLRREIDRVRDEVGTDHAVAAVHLGGGTPTFFSDEQLAVLVAHIDDRLGSTKDSEMSIEVDPRTVTPERLAHLRTLGFGRISFGVQDFDPTVQVAVHRVQPLDDVRALIYAARREDFESINVDLIYGLPRQTPKSFARTIAMTTALRPDRVALYAYAHLPQRFKPQRRIVEGELPSAGERVAMLDEAIALFLQAGYDYIGMDHFALPTDALARARREGKLHRDFQGYGTAPAGDLLGIGVSAISQVGGTYYQNATELDAYHDALANGRLPVSRGVVLSPDDRLRRAVIMRLMCDGQVDYATLDREFAIDTRRALRMEIEALAPFAAGGLVTLDAAGIHVTRQGWFVVRSIAMTFDVYLREGIPLQRFSRLI